MRFCNLRGLLLEFAKPKIPGFSMEQALSQKYRASRRENVVTSRRNEELGILFNANDDGGNTWESKDALNLFYVPLLLNT